MDEEKDLQTAADHAEAAQLPPNTEEEVPCNMWDAAEDRQGRAEGDEQLDELATALSGADEEPAQSYGLMVKDDALAYALVLLMMDSCPTTGHISSTIVARMTCDAARIRGQLVGYQKWTSVITQVIGNGKLGCEAVRHRFKTAMCSSRAIFDRLGPGSDNLPWLERNFVPYLRQIAACNQATQAGRARKYNLVLARSPLQFSPSDNPNDHNQSKWSPVFCFPRSPHRPTPVDLSDQWAGTTEDWLNSLYHVVPTPLLVQWILGLDGGTFCALTRTSPSGAMPDAWTLAVQAETQKPYEYAVLKKGKSAEVFAAERDPKSGCLTDEIEHANDERFNRRQFSLTRSPREKPTLDAPQTGPQRGGTRQAAELRALAQDQDPQLRAARGAIFTEGISDDDDERAQPQFQTRIEYEDQDFNNLPTPFNPDSFRPPPSFTKSKTYETDVVIRVPVKWSQNRTQTRALIAPHEPPLSPSSCPSPV